MKTGKTNPFLEGGMRLALHREGSHGGAPLILCFGPCVQLPRTE